jgi:uncharacterized surface anchored protein
LCKGFTLSEVRDHEDQEQAPALAAVFVLLLSFCAAGIAQVTTGSILGTVRDASGAVVPGATVTITDTGKGTTTAKQTDTEGNYSVPYLLPGTYNIQLEMKGFKRSVSEQRGAGYRPESPG